MDSIAQDLRYALRTLRKSPGFTTAAVLTLALGIGANTAIFSVLNGVLLKPLPYGDADRLLIAWEQNQRGDFRLPSYPTFLDWRGESGSVADLAFMRGASGALRTEEGATRVGGAFVSAGFFGMVDGRPWLGRTFSSEEERPAGSHVAVLTYDLWRRGFAEDRAVVGRSMTLDDGTYTIIGVLPPGFRYPEWADFYVPLAARLHSDSALSQRGVHADSRLLVLLKPKATPDEARTVLAGISTRLAAAYPKDNGGWTSVAMLPLREEVLGFGAVRPVLRLLATAVALVLLVACANVANMSLVRAATRTRELAIRATLGAGRGRVIRQLLTETGVLALAGGALGLLLAAWGIGLVRAAAPDGLPRVAEIRIDGWVLAFTMVVSLVTVVVVGVAPALRATPPDLAASLKEGTSAAGRSRARSRLRSSLVALEVALALVLLVGSGLLLVSFWRLSRVELGFNPARIVSLDVFPPGRKYDAPENAAELYRRVAEAIASLPGVERVALSNFVPLAGAYFPSHIKVPGRMPPPEGDEFVLFRTISADYFRTMEIPVRRGRPFTAAEVTSATRVAIVNETLARRYWPDQDPVGRPVTLFKSAQSRADFGQSFTAEVVGIVGDVRHTGLNESPAAEVYVPYTVNPWGHVAVIARTRVDPATLLVSLRRAVSAVDPDIPVVGATESGGMVTMKRLLADQLARRRFTVILLVAFAVAALLLAALGIYGVISYVVTLRTHEIGIRTALGATSKDVRVLVVVEALRVVAVGLVAGLAGAFGLTRLLRSLLYGVGPTDPGTFLTVTLLLAAVAFVASYLPARRASRVDPMVALRTE